MSRRREARVERRRVRWMREGRENARMRRAVARGKVEVAKGGARRVGSAGGAGGAGRSGEGDGEKMAPYEFDKRISDEIWKRRKAREIEALKYQHLVELVRDK